MTIYLNNNWNTIYHSHILFLLSFLNHTHTECVFEDCLFFMDIDNV